MSDQNSIHEPDNNENSIGGYVPKTDLGRRLLVLRRQYAAGGGKFLNREELDAEIARRRLGCAPSDDPPTSPA